MNNADVAQVFNEVAVLLELTGADEFRANAYRRAARAMTDLARHVRDVAAAGELEELPGVGSGTSEKIHELLTTGQLKLRQELIAQVPESVLKLLAVPAIGPKKAAVLWKDAGITSLEGLKAALQEGRLVGLKGFGPRIISSIERGVEFVERNSGRTRLGMAWKISTLLGGAVMAMKGIERYEFAGSLRRGQETVGDLNLICAADDGERIMRQFAQLPHVTQIVAASVSKGAVLVNYEPIGSLRVELRIVPARSFGAAWLCLTGSRKHVSRLRALALDRGWVLNELGLYSGDDVIASHTEEEIYDALGLPWIPPELREDRGEFEIEQVPGDLLTLAQIRGDLHMHTLASDGKNTVDEMAEAAKLRGYEYICITDHSKSSVLAGGLKEEILLGLMHDVRAADRRHPELSILIGSEVDVLSEGRLDYADEVLAQLDWVTASVHAGMSPDRDTNTRRALAAIRNPYVTALSHPTGRLINERDEMPLDLEAIAKEAARTGTALEINANNFRLDLKDEYARVARDLGAMITVNTDAHAIDQFEQMRFGVMTARRAWLRRTDVLNTRDLAGVRAFVRAKRRKLAPVPTAS